MDTHSNRFYVSTAINYTNGAPHIGHAYEAIAADVLARYQRLRGKQVYFLTGTDEHGQKVAESAEKEGLQPIQLCDKYAALFQGLNEKLHISNDFFVRTTQEKHHATSQWLWKKSADKGDIYLGAYEGWYNTREETFVTETEAKEADYKDPGSGKPLIKTKEPSYFFRMSKYQQPLVDHITNNPTFIQPAERRTEILARLKEPLLDLSVSRTTFSWGIPVPDSTTEEKHIMYVWFDALTNYLTGIDYPNGDLAKFWPCNVHLIGKDISWFHTVIWPCMLLSCDIPLPQTVLCHGFINAVDGIKMSKSLGNVVDPFELLKQYPADAMRYFLIREGVFGSDLAYNQAAFIARHDHELQATLGNLAQRGLKLVEIHCEGKVPTQEPETLFDIAELAVKIEDAYSKFQFQIGVELAFEQLRVVNNWLAVKAPWTMKEEDKKEEKLQIIRTLLESLYILAHFLLPVIPIAMEKLFSALNHTPRLITELKWNILTPGTDILLKEQLFPRLEDSKFVKKQKGVPAPQAKPAPKAKGGKQQQPRKERPAKKVGEEAKPGKGSNEPLKEQETPTPNPVTPEDQNSAK